MIGSPGSSPAEESRAEGIGLKIAITNMIATNIMCVTVLDYTNAEEIRINTIDDEKLEELYRKYGISED